MKTKTHVLIAILFAIIANLSCTKTTEEPVSIVDNTKVELVSRAENIALSHQITEDFVENLPPTTTVDQLFSPLFQSGTAYSDLASSSIAVLQAADILDSVKYYLNITSNSDPHLILAAKLVTEMYDSLPTGGSIPRWLGCILSAGLSLTPVTLESILKEGATPSGCWYCNKTYGY